MNPSLNYFDAHGVTLLIILSPTQGQFILFSQCMIAIFLKEIKNKASLDTCWHCGCERFRFSCVLWGRAEISSSHSGTDCHQWQWFLYECKAQGSGRVAPSRASFCWNSHRQDSLPGLPYACGGLFIIYLGVSTGIFFFLLIIIPFVWTHFQFDVRSVIN